MQPDESTLTGSASPDRPTATVWASDSPSARFLVAAGRRGPHAHARRAHGGDPLPPALRTGGHPVHPAPREEARRLKVLVVDDDEDVSYPIVTVLDWSGADTRCVASGHEALASLERWRPKVALLYPGIPGMDGYVRARHMVHAHPAAALIAISGWGQPEDIARCREAGFSGHFVKPVDLEAVSEAVRRLAARR